METQGATTFMEDKAHEVDPAENDGMSHVSYTPVSNTQDTR